MNGNSPEKTVVLTALQFMKDSDDDGNYFVYHMWSVRNHDEDTQLESLVKKQHG